MVPTSASSGRMPGESGGIPGPWLTRQQLPRNHLELEDGLHALQERIHGYFHHWPLAAVLLGVSPPSMDELALLRHPHRNVGREELAHRGLERDGLVLVHQPPGRVGQLARRGEMRRHAAELVLRELEFADGFPELLALAGVAGRHLERGLRETAGPAAGLEPAGREALHLEVEALALAALLADEVRRRHEVALEAEGVGVHAAIARRAIRLAVQHAAARLLHLELVAGERILRDDEQRQAACALLGIGIRAREQREHVGAAREGAPGLDRKST